MSLKAVVTQHQHILTLVNRLTDIEHNLAKEFLSKPDWPKFVKDNIDGAVDFYLRDCLDIKWEDTNTYFYKIHFNFYQGKDIEDVYLNRNTPMSIKSFDMRIEIRKKYETSLQTNSLQKASDEEINDGAFIFVLNTKPIDIETFDSFLNS
jgi:hypothetical protein